MHYIDGFVDDVRIVLFGEVVEVFAADVGPEGDEGEVVFDYWSGYHVVLLDCCGRQFESYTVSVRRED